jgi:type III restriction enzyme
MASLPGDYRLSSFYERPILNSPYRAPELHHPLDENGQPREGEPRSGRPSSAHLFRLKEKSIDRSGVARPGDLYGKRAYQRIRGYLDSWRALN